jgi:hypothetical protein
MAERNVARWRACGNLCRKRISSPRNFYRASIVHLYCQVNFREIRYGFQRARDTLPVTYPETALRICRLLHQICALAPARTPIILAAASSNRRSTASNRAAYKRCRLIGVCAGAQCRNRLTLGHALSRIVHFINIEIRMRRIFAFKSPSLTKQRRYANHPFDDALPKAGRQ